MFQLAELFRRGIVLPKDELAAQIMAGGWARSVGDAQQVIEIDGPLVEAWHQRGTFNRIMNSCGVRVSDYEETVIPANKTLALAETLTSDEAVSGYKRVHTDIVQLCRKASSLGLPLIWVL